MTFKLGEIVSVSAGARASPTKTELLLPPTCPRTGKVKHTRASADLHLRALAALANETQAERLDKYRCWSCGMWHVGHKDW